jgi:hypothetical protein
MAGRINRLKRSRSERKIRPLRLGGYLIITDTEATEVNYFLGLKESIPPMLKGDLQINVFKNKDLDNIINFASSERNKDFSKINIGSMIWDSYPIHGSNSYSLY